MLERRAGGALFQNAQRPEQPEHPSPRGLDTLERGKVDRTMGLGVILIGSRSFRKICLPIQGERNHLSSADSGSEQGNRQVELSSADRLQEPHIRDNQAADDGQSEEPFGCDLLSQIKPEGCSTPENECDTPEDSRVMPCRMYPR